MCQTDKQPDQGEEISPGPPIDLQHVVARNTTPGVGLQMAPKQKCVLVQSRWMSHLNLKHINALKFKKKHTRITKARGL